MPRNAMSASRWSRSVASSENRNVACPCFGMVVSGALVTIDGIPDLAPSPQCANLASPCVEGVAFDPKRGEGDASAAWIGHCQPYRAHDGRSKSLDASGGGEPPRPRQTPPPRNAIGLSSP